MDLMEAMKERRSTRAFLEKREELSLSDEKQVIIGVAVGYGDPDAPVNGGRSERVPLRDVVKWRP